jgi:integrase
MLKIGVHMNKKQKKRAGNRMGYLYKVDKNKVYPANSPIKGKYWLQLQVNGHKKRIPLKNECGDRITDFEEAQRIRQKLVAPLLIKEQKNAVEFILSSLNELKDKEHTSNVAKQDTLNNTDSNVKIKDALEKYKKIRLESDLSQIHYNRTLNDCQHLIEYIKKDHPEKLYMTEITTYDIKEFLDTGGNILPRTFNCRVSSLLHFFDIVMDDYKDENLAYINPVQRIKIKALNTGNSHSKRVLTSEELKRILEEAKKISDELYLLFLIGTTTGLRLGDVCSLNWSEIDLDKNLIHKIASKTKRFTSKPVVIGIVEVLKDALLKIDIEKRSGYVLPYYSKYNEKKTEFNKIITVISGVFKASGIQTTIPAGIKGKRRIGIVGFHSFRHTFITKHAEMGTPLPVILESVGHSRAAMTIHYMQISENKVVEASKKFTI